MYFSNSTVLQEEVVYRRRASLVIVIPSKPEVLKP